MIKKFAGFFARLILVLGGVLFPILMLELAVRILHLAPPPIPNPTIWDTDPVLGWRHIANSGGTFYSSYNEYQAEVKINALGLRDDEYLSDYTQADDKFKVMILADSFGESLQVPLEQTFFKQLQQQLRQNGVNAQTINTGVGNWGTDQELTYFKTEGKKFKPNLTLLFFYTANDTINNYAPLEIARNGGSIQKNFYQLNETGSLIEPPPFDPDNAYSAEYPKPAPLPAAPYLKAADWLWLNSDLYRRLQPYLRDIPPVLKALGPGGWLGGEGRIRASHPLIPVPFYVYQSPPPADWQAAWQLTGAVITTLRDQANLVGSQFAVVIIPAREQVYPQEWDHTVAANPTMQGVTWDLNTPNQQLTRILEANAIPYVDLLPVFQQAAAQPNAPKLYFIHDGHWNQAGHTLAGQTVFQFLQKLGLHNSSN